MKTHQYDDIISPTRCPWCGTDPDYVRYHDTEWGVPVTDDTTMFEFLVLESFQAGLSWLTILKKRENFRRAFHKFDPEKVARMTEADQAKLLEDKSIIRNRAKIAAAINNAQKFLDLKDKMGGQAHMYFWDYVDGAPTVNHFKTMAEVPCTTKVAENMSKDMKKRGFAFMGPTVLYSHMQATGIVNDHLVGCHRHAPLARIVPDLTSGR